MYSRFLGNSNKQPDALATTLPKSTGVLLHALMLHGFPATLPKLDEEMMENPFIAADGFTYERYAIEAWFDRHNISPVTKQKLQHKMLIPNRMLHSAIQEWKQRVKPA